MPSFTEENYLKIIYHLASKNQMVQTNAIAAQMQTKPASVTDMLKKLADKALINYVKYQGVSLTDKGEKAALGIIRKHRLWEVFLVNKLHFKWDEVHEVAEELEHIQSAYLIEKLDAFLGYPKYDPHGDPIPDHDGQLSAAPFAKLAELGVGERKTITGVNQHSSAFLQHLDHLGLTLGKQIVINNVIEFDGSMVLVVNQKEINISKEVAQHILVS